MEKSDIRSELHGTGIPVRDADDLEDPSDLPPGLTIVVRADSDTLGVYFKRTLVGKIMSTTGETGDEIWQCVSVTSFASKDLHRVAFKVAALHPPID